MLCLRSGKRCRRTFSLEKAVKDTGDESIIDCWAKLLTSDHFYYMCTKYWNDGDVHKYFSHYNTPYDAYINYMNIVTDLEHVLEVRQEEQKDDGNRETTRAMIGDRVIG